MQLYQHKAFCKFCVVVFYVFKIVHQHIHELTIISSLYIIIKNVGTLNMMHTKTNIF